ncbi:MAG: hypothetical protein J5802_00310 [Butyrivibrio sp.]|nr:hypothetical protein [Butyrivibrio sp.]
MKERKIATILMASVMVCVLMGCGNTVAEVNSETATQETSVADDATVTENKETTTKDTDKTSDNASKMSSEAKTSESGKKAKIEASAEDAAFEYNGQTISILDDAQATLGALGTPEREEPSPFSDNGDVSYIYGSDPNTVEYMPLKVDGDALVPDSVIIYDKNVKTSKSVGVGSTEDDIKNAYGEPDNVSKSGSTYELAYDFGSFAVGFDFDNKKKVNAIIFSNMDTFNKYVNTGKS